MNVDFNNLRLGIQTNFNAIVSMLKDCSHAYGGIEMDDNEVFDLQVELNDLRDRLATLMCMYTDESNNIADQAELALVELIEE